MEPFNAICLILGSGLTVGAIFWNHLAHKDISNIKIIVDGGSLEETEEQQNRRLQMEANKKKRKREKLNITIMAVIGAILVLVGGIPLVF